MWTLYGNIFLTMPRSLSSVAFDPQKMPILFMSVSGPMGPAELRELSRRQIKPALERIVGVASADIAGGLKRQIQVQIDPEALHAHGLSTDAIVSSLRRENYQVPGGKIEEKETEFSIRTLSEYTSVKDIADTVIGYRNETPIYIKNVASVLDTYERITRVVRNNQKPGGLAHGFKEFQGQYSAGRGPGYEGPSGYYKQGP